MHPLSSCRCRYSTQKLHEVLFVPFLAAHKNTRVLFFGSLIVLSTFARAISCLKVHCHLIHPQTTTLPSLCSLQIIFCPLSKVSFSQSSYFFGTLLSKEKGLSFASVPILLSPALTNFEGWGLDSHRNSFELPFRQEAFSCA